MERHFLDFIRGYVKILIIGNNYDRFLNLCAFHEISLWDLKPDGESYEAYILRKDFKKLKSIVKKSHAVVRITERHGLPFFIHKNRKRKVYLAGIAVAFVFMVWLSAHVWSIQIEGNLSQTDDVVFEYLGQSGISHGMWKSKVDCKELAAELRNYFTEFAWVAAELKGTRLVIHVKEGIMDVKETESGSVSDEPSSLAASCSGVVDSIFVRKGTPMVKAGDQVEKGTILVSGALPIYNDEKEIASYQYVSADADIVIKRERKYQDVVSFIGSEKQYTGKEKINWMVWLGEEAFALPANLDDFEKYDMLSELTQLRLTENFYLPVYIQKFTAKEYEDQEILYTKEEVLQILNTNYQDFIKNLKEKGVQIFENDVKIEWNEKSAIASGILMTGEYAVNRINIDTTKEEF